MAQEQIENQLTSTELSELLNEHRESRRRLSTLGRRELSPALHVLLWALRIYVILMVGIVVMETFSTMK